MSLDYSRNKLMKYSIHLNICALPISVAGLIAGIAGMNVPNHYETSDLAIFYVLSGIGLASVSLYFVLSRLYQKSASMRGLTDRMKILNFFAKLNSPTYIRKNYNHMDRKTFRQTMSVLGDRESDESFEKVFSTFDKNHDGSLDGFELNQVPHFP